MFRVSVVVTVLLLSLAAVLNDGLVTAMAAPVYPLKVGPTGRYLVDQNNTPFLLVGDAAWSLIVQPSETDAETYLADRAIRGFNAVLVNLIEHKHGDNVPADYDDDPPFTSTVFTTPNEAYFSHADAVIAAAAANGIVVFLAPLYLGYGCSDEGWCSEISAASTSDMTSWGEYLGNRYKDFPNIVWVIGGDTDPTSVANKVTAFVTGLTSVDTNHVITAHNDRGTMATTYWPGASWLTVNSTYTGGLTYQLAQTAYSASPTEPFFLIEEYYENEHSTTDQARRAQSYWTLLSGGFGHIFGNCPIWNFDALIDSNYCDSATTWQDSLDLQGSLNMTNFERLFSSRNWYQLVPDFAHTVVTAGFGTDGQANYAATGRTSDGSVIITYCPAAMTLTVDMTKLSGPATARWYDPANGTFTNIGGSPFANVGSHNFTTPGANAGGDEDWVLVLERKSDTTPPDTTITSSPAPLNNSSTAIFSFSSTETGSTFACNLDSGGFSACSSPKSYTLLADGSHSFQVQATDAAGNADPTPASFTWTIDTTAPDTVIDTNPANPTNSTSAAFTFHSTESGSTFQCQIDSGEYSRCTSPANYTGLAAGDHNFNVKATDSAGNSDPTPANYNWKITAASDFNGDGISDFGLFRNGGWYLDLNGNGQWDGCEVDGCFVFGLFGDQPVVGDWTGSGEAKIGVYRNGGWYLDLNGNGQWDGCEVDGCAVFGLAGDMPAN